MAHEKNAPGIKEAIVAAGLDWQVEPAPYVASVYVPELAATLPTWQSIRGGAVSVFPPAPRTVIVCGVRLAPVVGSGRVRCDAPERTDGP
jgi:hypothetical protein